MLDKKPEEDEAQNLKEELLEEPGSLYGTDTTSQQFKSPSLKSSEERHKELHRMHHPGMHSPSQYSAERKKERQGGSHIHAKQPDEPASEYMSLGKEEHGKRHKKEEPWMHPETLTPEERDRLIREVPKDTIELLKEGHTEYVLK